MESISSRRDWMKVAWHEVPEKQHNEAPSRRDGLSGVLLSISTSELSARLKQPYRCNKPDHTVPNGTGSLGDASPGTSCQATFIQSLRDKRRHQAPLLSP